MVKKFGLSEQLIIKRCDIFKTRNTSDMKLFINNNIKQENNIITDGWP